MSFTPYDLGYQNGGEVIEVRLEGNAANVKLMDGPNFRAYRSGQRHRYIGGLVRQSVVRLGIPGPGHWYAVVDLYGLQGRVKSSILIHK